MKRAILATGGMDSTTLIYKSMDEGVRPTLLSVNYGHAAWERQLEMLQHHVELLGLDPVVEIPVAYLHWQAKDGLFTGNGVKDQSDNPFGEALFKEQEMRYKENFIEGRNLIMVAYCMAYASAHKIDELWAGYVRGEIEWDNQRAYKMITGDNSPQFVDLLNVMAFMGFTNQVRIRAPYYEQRMGKAEVVQLGRSLGVDFSKTHSCYWPEPCGMCDNCLLREAVL
jgi:7-cyano-7-deazaguanine synthase